MSSTNTYFDAKTKVDRVELPLLVKFAIAGRASVHPFIAAGASVQYNRSAVVSAFWGFKGTFGDTGFVVVTSRPVRHAFVAGPTAAAGVAFGSKRLRPSLEFRYTRWLDSAVETDPNPLFPYLSVVRSNQNQAQFLLGLMFWKDGYSGSRLRLMKIGFHGRITWDWNTPAAVNGSAWYMASTSSLVSAS